MFNYIYKKSKYYKNNNKKTIILANKVNIISIKKINKENWYWCLIKYYYCQKKDIILKNISLKK